MIREKTQEEVIEITLLKNSIKDWKANYWEVELDDREIDEDLRDWLVYNWWEMKFFCDQLTIEIYHYVDWDYNIVSRLRKWQDETLENFLIRAMELNERLREVITFEER